MVRLNSSFGLALAFVLLLNSGNALAQNEVKEVSDKGVSFGEQQTTRWRVGVVVTAVNGPMKSVRATVPIPIEWPEQDVKVVDEDVSRGVKVSHRDLGGVRQLLVRMPRIPNGRTAKALFTYEITRKEVIAPTDHSVFEIPKKVPKNLKRWLNNSPYIDSRDRKIRSLAKESSRRCCGVGKTSNRGDAAWFPTPPLLRRFRRTR